MNYQKAIELLGNDFDKDGYTKKQARSQSRHLWILNAKYGLARCTHDWPAPYHPSTEDMNATDWEIYSPKEYTEEERNNFAIAFAVWCIGPEGEMYRATKMPAGKLLQTYLDRPYIDITNPQSQ